MNSTPNKDSDSNDMRTIPEEGGKKRSIRNKNKRHKNRKHKTSSSNSSSNGESVSNNENNSEDKGKVKNQNIIKDLIAENFVMLTLIGQGAFGQIMLSYNMRENIEVAIKKESRRPQKVPQLKTEAKIYQTGLNIATQDINGTKALAQEEVQGVPKFYGMGEGPDGWYLIMEFLGPNLIELLNYCGTKKFTISTVCLIALQLLNRIETLHKHNFIHRDIKPENFGIGTQEKSNVIYGIDFGLSKRYKNPKNHHHIPYREGRLLTGTARYVSINTHLGIEQSRRDDGESIGYVGIFFGKGSLPWQGGKAVNDKYQRIMEKKLQIPTEILCYGLPDEMAYYLNYCKSGRFEDRPDYDYGRGLFIKLLSTCNTVYGLTRDFGKFDWCFENPANTIWQIFNKNKKGNSIGPHNFKNESVKELLSFDKGDDSKVKCGGIGNPQKLSNIKQGTDIAERDQDENNNFAKTNENNPNNVSSSGNMSSSSHEDKDGNQKKEENIDDKVKKDDDDKESGKSEDKSDESENTIKQEFNGFGNSGLKDNQKVNFEVKNAFFNGTMEDIDRYIIQLLKAKDIKTESLVVKGSGRLDNEQEKEKEKEKESVKSNNSNNKNKKNKNQNKKMNSKDKEQDYGKDNKSKESDDVVNSKNGESDVKEQSGETLVIVAKNKALKDSLDIPSAQPREKKAIIPLTSEEIQKKRIKADKALGSTVKETDKDELLKNTFRNSQILSPEELEKTGKEGEDKMKKKDRKSRIKFNLDDAKEASESNNNHDSNIDSNNKEISEFKLPTNQSKCSRNEGSEFKSNTKNSASRKGKIDTKVKKKIENDQAGKEASKADEGSSSKHSNTNGEKTFENSVISKISNQEGKEFRQASKILEDNNNNALGNEMKVSKENMIKLSKEPINKSYFILGDLGQGSYGQVKRVKHKQGGEERAMKIVNKNSSDSANEMEILKKICHPNTLNVFQIFEDSKKYYIMTELLEGGELFDVIISQGSFSEADAARIMKQLGNAVTYLHSKNIIHRDGKPENIMLTSKPKNNKFEIKIIDFGTAKIFVPGKKETKFIGTSYYIAPEVLNENYDERCDVWSCGIILYILLCGYPPFNGNTNRDIYSRIQNTHPIFGGEEWQDITKEAIDLIKQMLIKNPKKRPSSEACLNHKWFKGLEESEKSKSSKNFKAIQVKVINKMSQFVKENRLKQAVLQFITIQFNIKKEEVDGKEIFKEGDTENKGQISKEVYCNLLCEIYGDEEGKLLTNKIFNQLDLDGSGEISYDEFLSAMIDSKKVVTADRLEKAFKMFDKDGNGRGSVHEIMEVFGGDEATWKKVIEEIDLNKDGEVDFKEFKTMMTTINSRIILGDVPNK